MGQQIYHRPECLDEALAALAAGGVTVAAGCTDLFPTTEAPRLKGAVLDVTAVDALRGVTRDARGWRIGAATTWSAIRAADLPPAFDMLKLAAREVGSIQIQNAGTIGGNLCNASPAADGVPPLLALDAMVELRSARRERVLPLAEFLTGPRRTALAPGEMVTAILVPGAAGAGVSDFVKLGARKYLVISIAMVAARLVLEGGVIRQAALAVGSCGPVATRLPAVEAALEGCAIADAAARVKVPEVSAALSPIDDIRADAAYRSGAAAQLLRRSLARIAAGQGAA